MAGHRIEADPRAPGRQPLSSEEQLTHTCRTPHGSPLADAHRMLGDVRAGRLSALVAGRFPLRDAGVACALLSDSSVPGKLLLMTSFGGDACAA
jgi:hypothetical protein